MKTEIRKKFIQNNPNVNPLLIDEYIKRFNQQKDQHKISGKDKDISTWTKYDSFLDFVKFVERIEATESKKTIKKSKKLKSIKVIDTDKLTVIIPLSTDASCYYGKHTSWCTNSRSSNDFYSYFKNGFTLFYVIVHGKDFDSKYAANYSYANYSYGGMPNFYDESDDIISEDDFEEATGLNSSDIEHFYHKHAEEIIQARADITDED